MAGNAALEGARWRGLDAVLGVRGVPAKLGMRGVPAKALRQIATEDSR